MSARRPRLPAAPPPGFAAVRERRAPIPPPPPSYPEVSAPPTGFAASVADAAAVPDRRRAPIPPSYPEMVLEVIDALGRGNTSKEQISLYMKSKYGDSLPDDPHRTPRQHPMAEAVPAPATGVVDSL